MDENLAKNLDRSKTGNEDFLRWLRDVMLTRPQNSYYLNSDRGIEKVRCGKIRPQSAAENGKTRARKAE